MSIPHQKTIESAFLRHTEAVKEALTSILPGITQGAEMLSGVVQGNHQLLVCGNGGSAADSQHFAAEWTCRYKKERGPLRAIALTTDSSALSAIGNDYGFEKVFSRQVEALGSEGDVFLAISTSGQSPNILTAIEAAKKKGLKVILLTGKKGETQKSNPLIDLLIAIPSEETARIQEVHEIIYHAWCECLDAIL